MSAVDAYALAGRGRRETDALVMRHAELVKRIAYHLAGRLPPSVDVEDLIQAGMLGLLEAASNYSSGRGASFETYAGIRIRGSMIDALRKLDWAPRSVHRKAREVAQAIRELEKETERLAAMVRFHVRRYLKEKEIPSTATKAALKALNIKPDRRKTDGESAVDRTARYFKSGMDCDEIARRMELNVSTVYGYLSKARHRGLIEPTTRVPKGKKTK